MITIMITTIGINYLGGGARALINQIMVALSPTLSRHSFPLARELLTHGTPEERGEEGVIPPATRPPIPVLRH